MNDKIDVPDARGSLWHRWDPHIHAPGTILNDQYRGADPWGDFITKVNAAKPAIRALGITDYLDLSCYEKAAEYWRQGRLPGVGLVFPNVEMRAIETARGSGLNLHLLVSPHDADHLDQLKRFLMGLTFQFGPELYRCQRDDLIRLGRAFAKSTAKSITDDRAALEIGTNQFKISLDQLRKAMDDSAWARRNCLVGVAAGADGTSGLQKGDGAFDAVRRNVESFAHVIFSGSQKQAEFWLGQGAATQEQLQEFWKGKKPCLHGSDAHDAGRVGAPDQDRFCWIKGDLTFESLRQACMEPEGRVYVGLQPSRGSLPAHTIREMYTRDASWLPVPSIPINPGLVAIIGARGSGKTALADMIAAAGYALSPHLNDRSFIKRAGSYLGKAYAGLRWEAGDDTGNDLAHAEMEDLLDSPRVQYLSQQFVDQLCSAEGLDDALVAEIERVIFGSHKIEDRDGAANFRELLEQRTEAARVERDRQLAALAQAADELVQERARKSSKHALEKQRTDLGAAIKKDRADRQGLIGKGQEARGKRYEEISAAVEQARLRVEAIKRREMQLNRVRDAVKDLRDNRIPTWIEQLKEANSDAGLTPADWKLFEIKFVGDTDRVLSEHTREARAALANAQGPAPNEIQPDFNKPPSLESYLPVGTPLADLPLSLLEKEQKRLSLLVGVDANNTKKLTALSQKITQQESYLEKLGREIERAAGADARIADLITKRNAAYEAIIAALVAEEERLTELYAPLGGNLAQQKGALGKLTFSVRRVVDLSAWAKAGEELLDLRKQGPFKGRDALLSAARTELLAAWERGTPHEVMAAMERFRDVNEAALASHAPVSREKKDEYNAWGRQISKWLYSTDHIKVSYGLQYDGVQIEQLSPGTRGIVLLLLYLAIDGDDDRPLIIDQPEENLDPQSIFQDLVHRFKDAKTRRQVIIVTHNANLVVNTDADQVVIATCGAHRPGQLPEIRYESGGLENPSIRGQVCEILEGGEEAFRERAKRLRVSWNE